MLRLMNNLSRVTYPWPESCWEIQSLLSLPFDLGQPFRIFYIYDSCDIERQLLGSSASFPRFITAITCIFLRIYRHSYSIDAIIKHILIPDSSCFPKVFYRSTCMAALMFFVVLIAFLTSISVIGSSKASCNLFFLHFYILSYFPFKRSRWTT